MDSNSNQMMYAVNAPYPSVQVTEKNPLYAKEMLDNLGGNISEMSAVSLYFYNNIVTENCAEVSKAFHNISIIEMHHMDIFAKLSCNLGADPRLWTYINSQCRYWTPAYNNYFTNLKELLQNSLYSELNAIEKYTLQSRTIKDKVIVNNLKRIILDEEKHIEIFKQLYNKYIK